MKETKHRKEEGYFRIFDGIGWLSMALPIGKLTILVGAGLHLRRSILGSVLAKEGRLPDVSNFVSGAFKIAFRQLKQDDSTSSVSKSSKPPNDSLMAQVNSLRQELQMLASSRPVTIVTANGTGSNKYGVVVVVVVVGYGYVWWKGWKLPDMMFATRCSLSDACTSIAQQLENVYSSIRSTRRHLSSKIDGVDSNLNAVAELTASTQEKVIELREDSSRIGNDVRYVRDAVETLELKISRIEGKQDLTTQGVKRLCDYASSLENNLLEENAQACHHLFVSFWPFQYYVTELYCLPWSTNSADFSIQFTANILIKVFTSFCFVIYQAGALPAPSSEPSTPASIGSQEVQRPPCNAASPSSQQRSNGISGVAELASGLGISKGIHTEEETSNGTSWFKPAFLMRTRSATNSVVQQTSSSRQQS
ncbi:hypothetical protein POTOM_012540 [Populus tomentosa]|uniref:DUF1664 domain-containing protein n=1 Tax=Populus tomentosa TaxID=118781 RepID=A0A8X8A9U2_POPTO|nr:hypothetical protein POTOM_012540 [Populus tomentosa]